MLYGACIRVTVGEVTSRRLNTIHVRVALAPAATSATRPPASAARAGWLLPSRRWPRRRPPPNPAAGYWSYWPVIKKGLELHGLTGKRRGVGLALEAILVRSSSALLNGAREEGFLELLAGHNKGVLSSHGG